MSPCEDNGEAPDVAGARESRSALEVSCTTEGITSGISNLDGAQPITIDGNAVEVTWNMDGRWQGETWDAWTQSFEYYISPPDVVAFYQALRGADTLTVSRPLRPANH